MQKKVWNGGGENVHLLVNPRKKHILCLLFIGNLKKEGKVYETI